MGKGQIAIEFLLLIGISFATIMVLMVAALYYSEDNNSRKTYTDLEDLGSSLRQEVMLASKLEDGYNRKINLPISVNDLDYNITVIKSNFSSYIVITYHDVELYYHVPQINGTFIKGDNYLIKNVTGIYVHQ